MNARQAWWLKLALLVLVLVGLVGAWEAYQGMGSFTPQAQAKDNKDDDKDNGKDFDHLACYEILENNNTTGVTDGATVVRLYNQFEGKYGVEVHVGELKVPVCRPRGACQTYKHAPTAPPTPHLQSGEVMAERLALQS
jgi:hypothetical protein